MKTALRLCATLLASMALLGQTPPKDVDGWGKIKWGMTAEDVRSAYGLTNRLTGNCVGVQPGCWDSMALEPVKVGDLTMIASAKAVHGSERISRVSLWLHFGFSTDAPHVGPPDFDTLKTLLIQKYGPPVSEETKEEYGDPVKTVLWTFPSTSILLKLSQSPSLPNIGSISLEYTGIDKKALDAL